ncbi:hypothetical protein SAMN05428953_10694 [Mesorhizobium muleiense]|uniref:Uncharacterized protein n=1 Tax=Mesorhizobium muleiense TaxID=1004279 RepID=A0A1G8TIU6_9HYPH|nr:hypothetical protein SAMN05428953_10694 [Mesorhizobium muleiense]
MLRLFFFPSPLTSKTKPTEQKINPTRADRIKRYMPVSNSKSHSSEWRLLSIVTSAQGAAL